MAPASAQAPLCELHKQEIKLSMDTPPRRTGQTGDFLLFDIFNSRLAAVVTSAVAEVTFPVSAFATRPLFAFWASKKIKNGRHFSIEAGGARVGVGLQPTQQDTADIYIIV